MPNMTKQQYIDFQKETIAKSRNVYQKALNYCPTLFTQEVYPEFLEFMGKWNHFSAINTVLLYMQKPDASYLSGFQKWQRLAQEQGFDSNYTIIKPEYRKKGITLLVPFSFSNVQDANVSQEEQRFLTYRSILVFDVSQINGLQAPPCFTPYVEIRNIEFTVFLSLFRQQFQTEVRFAIGNAEDPLFKFSRAYLKGNTIYFQDAAPDNEKTIDIMREIIRFYVYEICKDEKERNLVLLSVHYIILHYYKYPVNLSAFSSISHYQELLPDRLFRIIHYICTISQFFIYEIYKAYGYFLTTYSDKESNKILKNYKDT